MLRPRGGEEIGSNDSVSRFIPIWVQVNMEYASCSRQKTLRIFATEKHDTHQAVEMQQLWLLDSQDWNWSWWKEKLSE